MDPCLPLHTQPVPGAGSSLSPARSRPAWAHGLFMEQRGKAGLSPCAPLPSSPQPAPHGPQGRKKALWGLLGKEERICQHKPVNPCGSALAAPTHTDGAAGTASSLKAATHPSGCSSLFTRVLPPSPSAPHQAVTFLQLLMPSQALTGM